MTFHPDTRRDRDSRDGPHASAIAPEEALPSVLMSRVSWAAVFAGVAVALVVQLILNLLGIGLGAATFDPASNNNPSASTFSIGAGIWWTVSGIIAALGGGYTAGRLAGPLKQSSGAWHGFTAWAVTTLLVFYLLGSTMGSIVGGALRTLSGAAAGMAQNSGATAQTAVQLSATTDPLSSLERSIRDASGGRDPGALRDAAVSAVRALVTADPQHQDEARESAVQAIAKAQNIPIDQARSRVGQYEQHYRQMIDEAKHQATVAAEAATTTLSRGALFGALALILGGIAGWFGGWMGAVRPAVTGAGRTRRMH
jgi:hypothetical protein